MCYLLLMLHSSCSRQKTSEKPRELIVRETVNQRPERKSDSSDFIGPILCGDPTMAKEICLRLETEYLNPKWLIIIF